VTYYIIKWSDDIYEIVPAPLGQGSVAIKTKIEYLVDLGVIEGS